MTGRGWTRLATVALLVAALARTASAEEDPECKGEQNIDLVESAHGLPIRLHVRWAVSRWTKISAQLHLLPMTRTIEVDGQRVYVSKIQPAEEAEIIVERLDAQLTIGAKCTLRFTDADMVDYARSGRHSSPNPRWADSWDKVFENCSAEDAKAVLRRCGVSMVHHATARLGGMRRLTDRLLAEKQADELVAEGDRLLRDRRHAEALERFEKALALHADNFRAREGRDQARRELERSSKQLEERAQTVRRLAGEARGRIQAGDLAGARALVGQIRAVDPASAEIGALERELAAAEKALRDRETVEPGGDGGAGAAAAPRLVAEGEAHEAAGNLPAALKSYQQALALQPGDAALRERVQKLEQRIQAERDAYEAEVRARVAASRGLDGRWRPLALTPEEQMAQWNEDMKYAIDQLAAGLAKAGKVEWFGLGIGLGGPALMLGISTVAHNVNTATYMQGVFGVFSVGIPVSVQVGLNNHQRKLRLERGRTELAEARTRCEGGALALCQEAVRLGGALLDLDRTAPRRSDASLLWGPGRLTGPRVAYYWMIGPVFGGYDDGTLTTGSATGVAMRIGGRFRVVRTEIGIDNRSGSMDDGTSYDMASLSAFLGGQLGAGLLAPYAGYRIGGSFGDPRTIGGLESGLTVGNTFHAHTLFSTKGPSHFSMVFDVSRTFALHGVLGDTWNLSLGFSNYVMPAIKYRSGQSAPASVAARLPPVPYPRTYREIMAYAFPLGVGVQPLRWNGTDGTAIAGRKSDGTPAGSPRVVFALGDVAVGVDGDGLRRLGASVVHAGFRKRIGRRTEIGGTFGAGADILWGRPDSPGTLGMMPVRPYVRMRTPQVALELGAHLPIFWLTRTPEGSKAPYQVDHFPGYLYAGVGF